MVDRQTIRRHLLELRPKAFPKAQTPKNTNEGDAQETDPTQYHAPLQPDADMDTGDMYPIPHATEPLSASVEFNEDNDQDMDTGLEFSVNDLRPVLSHRNPSVTIEDWPDPFWEPEFDSGSESGDEQIAEGDRDPEYVERLTQLTCDPIDEPELDDQEMRQLFEAELGDLADAEWIDMYTRIISTRDRHTLRLLATRLRTHFSRSTYEDLRLGVCESLEIPSESIAWRRLRILSQLETRTYDCCVNSCCCFLGKYKDLETCSYCNESRYGPDGKRRRAFRYSPLIPQLQGMFQSPAMAAKMRYRAEVERKPQGNTERGTEYDQDHNNTGSHGPVPASDNEPPYTIEDVFDGENYCTLRETRVDPDKPYHFFDNPEDIALGLSTDGFTLFKRRRRGLSTAWPIILINYNLHPRIRTRLENVICIGVIPGPKQPKDLNSFLIPLLEELPELEDGVEASGLRPDGTGYDFVFYAFIIMLFGDIPAIAKLLMMKGQNAFSPCRACYIEGFLCKLKKSSLYYVPLTEPGGKKGWDCEALQMRSHALFLVHYDELDNAPNQAERNRIAKEWGINGQPIFAHLKSVDLATIAPYDIMHLLFENLVPNLIKHWTGTFKGLSQGTGAYQLSKLDWEIIGRQTANAAKLIPSAFVGTLPDIAQDGNLYKAEAHSFWIQHIAPIVLKGRLPEKYYKHLQLLREIIIQCLQMRITQAEVDHLESMINDWVQKYELYYYQYKQSRLPTCPLTIHALLHMPFYIRKTGPLWASWAFVMERFCGHLLPAVKNRTRPYEHLDNYIQRRAQMQIVSSVYNLPSLAKPLVYYRTVEGVDISSHETIYPEFPTIVLGRPRKKISPAEVTGLLLSRFTRYFGVTYNIQNAAQLRMRVNANSVIRYGRFRMTGDGDRVRTAAQIEQDSTSRDNSYVRYVLNPDANAAFRNRPDVPVREVQYGRLLDIYHVEFTEDDGTSARYLLAGIQPCNTRGLDAAVPFAPPVKYRTMGTVHFVHIDTIESVIGRVEVEGGWAIIDPGREALRTQFVDRVGNELE